MENQRQRIEQDGIKLLPPKMFRRATRIAKHQGVKYTNKRDKVGSNRFNVGVASIWGASAIYSPKRRKFKGWQKENRKYRKAS